MKVKDTKEFHNTFWCIRVAVHVLHFISDLLGILTNLRINHNNQGHGGAGHAGAGLPTPQSD